MPQRRRTRGMRERVWVNRCERWGCHCSTLNAMRPVGRSQLSLDFLFPPHQAQFSLTLCPYSLGVVSLPWVLFPMKSINVSEEDRTVFGITRRSFGHMLPTHTHTQIHRVDVILSIRSTVISGCFHVCHSRLCPAVYLCSFCLCCT